MKLWQEIVAYLLLISSFPLIMFLTRTRRRSRAIERTSGSPAVKAAAGWWREELANHSPCFGSSELLAFASSLSRILARALVEEPHSLDRPFGVHLGSQRFVRLAAWEARIHIDKQLPDSLRMRFRDYQVMISRSNGFDWEVIWLK